MGFIATHYAPQDDNNSLLGERVFYTTQNAKIIDNMRQLIGEKVEREVGAVCVGSAADESVDSQ